MKTTYRAKGHAYFFGDVMRGRCIRGGPLGMLRDICSVVGRHGTRPRSNSCAGCLFKGKASGVLRGLKRRYARVMVTTGGPRPRGVGCRVSSFLCRYVILVIRGNVA